ncbi:LSU ribosomal protein L11P [Archaeoglobus sulfaticallidus PM70-1]|uniref:Large ribosomal subunit protein uL11 n=1 Tax=Archaeoglobus sulfaticallidus PM70-1 TaxID=387631 RepID=N0BCE7_9EURY|nr:50S ribosomal protein L11 [Archaeoglobus sulfaticallidus]AGK61289.1 LSU ribosomal protein L11P [Archaeoglobus sulfaticallidus PM70-1]
MPRVVEVLVPGGEASPGPPLGPAIGPLGLNVKQVVDRINAATKEYQGLSVPVKIIVHDDRSFDIEVGIPPVTALVKRELGITKGSSKTGKEFVGDISLEKIKEIAKMKKAQVLSYDLKSVVKEVLGTCLSMGVTVEGRSPKEIQKEIDEGKITIEE